MDTFISRIPSQHDVVAWGSRHRGKIAGLVAGSVGTLVVTTFLIVAITGVPFGGERLNPERTVIYPNL